MAYRGYDKRDRIQNLWVMSMPGATPESVGVSAKSQRDDAIDGKGLPWMMLPGTPGAHIMIPINPPAEDHRDQRPGRRRDRAGDAAAARRPAGRRRRLQVRREDRRAHGAAQGQQRLECTPRGADGFTWCYNEVTAAPARSSARSCGRRARQTRSPGRRRRGHQGGHDQADAVRHDVVSPLRQEESHPAALGDLGAGRHARGVGVSAGSQRDDAIDATGVPWLMLAGTPGAHIMIPINQSKEGRAFTARPRPPSGPAEGQTFRSGRQARRRRDARFTEWRQNGGGAAQLRWAVPEGPDHPPSSRPSQDPARLLCQFPRMRACRRFLVSGRVQGVGFRMFAGDAANREGIEGVVRNLRTGAWRSWPKANQRP